MFEEVEGQRANGQDAKTARGQLLFYHLAFLPPQEIITKLSVSFGGQNKFSELAFQSERPNKAEEQFL